MKKLNRTFLLGLLLLVIAANTYGQKIVTAGTYKKVNPKKPKFDQQKSGKA